MKTSRKIFKAFLATTLTATCLFTSVVPAFAVPATDKMTGFQIVEEMKIGWNLGNTLDCYNVENPPADFETAWGNPKTTQAMIDAVKEAGFNAVRIPITWAEHMDGNTIDEAWLKRVKEVVDYVMNTGMYAIINVHHDDYTWLCTSYEKETAVTERYVALWTQVADYFIDYDYHLLFEALNEPRVVGEENEWSIGTEESRDVCNNLIAAFVETVRKSGGNNADRFLVVTTHAASSEDDAINDFKLPDSHNLIVSVHYYFPYDFALNTEGTDKWGTDEDKAELDKGFDRVKKRFYDKGIPVIYGEFGVLYKNNDTQRAAYYNYFIKSAKQRGFTCFMWDNGLDNEFALLDRATCKFIHKNVLKAAISASTVENISLTYKGTARIKPETDDGDTVTYEIINPNIVSIDENTGKITAVGKGETDVSCTVTSPDGSSYTQTYHITVSYTWWQMIINILLFGWLWY